MELAIFRFACPLTGPRGSNEWKTNMSTNFDSGTPYWRPVLTLIAKHARMPFSVDPSFERSIQISPHVPSAYSLVRKNTSVPPMLNFQRGP